MTKKRYLFCRDALFFFFLFFSLRWRCRTFRRAKSRPICVFADARCELIKLCFFFSPCYSFLQRRKRTHIFFFPPNSNHCSYFSSIHWFSIDLFSCFQLTRTFVLFLELNVNHYIPKMKEKKGRSSLQLDSVFFAGVVCIRRRLRASASQRPLKHTVLSLSPCICQCYV